MKTFSLDYDDLYAAMSDELLQPWRDILPGQIHHVLFEVKHGDLQRWQEAISALPEIKPSSCDFNADCVRVGEVDDADAEPRRRPP